MPRKRARGIGRGGARAPDGRAVATPGVGRFATRTDFGRPAGTQPIATPGGLGLTQGAAKQMTEAQRAMPLPRAGTPNVPKPQRIPKGGFEAHLQRPSEFPDEHVTYGNADFDQADAEDMSSLKEWIPFFDLVGQRPGAPPELADLAQRVRAWFGE